MVILATTWLAASLVLCAYAWLGRRSYFALPAAALLIAAVMAVPLGQPSFTVPPAGQYTVLGARIDVDVAIYVLLDDGSSGAPVYYVLPYSNSRAGELQEAMDAAAGGGEVTAEVGTEGGVAYNGEPPATDTEQKQAETPELEVE
jgi:hypothetical protein